MYNFILKYATEQKILHTFSAEKLTYSGGDGVVVAVFWEGNFITGIAALQPGMVVVQK